MLVVEVSGHGPHIFGELLGADAQSVLCILIRCRRLLDDVLVHQLLDMPSLCRDPDLGMRRLTVLGNPPPESA